MRLICTNCDAQYEVDDSVIPDGGRDVQCSNCGHAWFQPGRFAADAGADDDADGVVHAESEPDGSLTAAPDGHGDDGDDGAAGPDAGPDADPDAGLVAALSDPEVTGDPGERPGGGTGPVPSSQLDDEMLAILREEAERETRARRAEGTADLEVQPDLGLTEGQTGARRAQSAAWERAPEAAGADLSGGMAPGATGPEHVADLSDEGEDARRGHRRELLPDIETINSTLRATTVRTDDGDTPSEEPELRARERGGFRLGFSISLIAAVILLALYVLAPSLAAQVPALSPALTAYVSAVNEARMWIDDLMRSSTEAMRGS